MLSRSGTTLPELMIAVTLASAVLATATASALRQQRTADRLGAQAAVASQLHPAAASVSAQLVQISAAAGDFVEGEWRDTALQFRAPVATAINCRAAVGAVVVSAESGSALPLGGTLSAPRAGDSLWFYVDSLGEWVGRVVTGTASSHEPCAGDDAAAVSMEVGGTDTIPVGAPVRVTRQQRLVVYRGSDGRWQLGLREWSDPTHEMSAPQPLAGPFLSATSLGERTGFRYFDADDRELHADGDPATTARVRRIRLTMFSIRSGGGGATPDAVQRDSVDVGLTAPRAP